MSSYSKLLPLRIWWYSEGTMAKMQKPEVKIVTQTNGIPSPFEDKHDEMEYQGLRYGGARCVRYATGRKDAAAPEFPWPAAENLCVGRQKRS